MSQAVLAARLGISSAAVSKLERAEVQDGITIGKLSQVARALGCSLVYALVPNSTLEETVFVRARVEAEDLLGYAARTMALEDQGIEAERQQEAIDDYARHLIAEGDIWRTARGRSGAGEI